LINFYHIIFFFYLNYYYLKGMEINYQGIVLKFYVPIVIRLLIQKYHLRIIPSLMDVVYFYFVLHVYCGYYQYALIL